MTLIQHDKNVISASWCRYRSAVKVRKYDVRGQLYFHPGVPQPIPVA